jgi:hypothetical protein
MKPPSSPANPSSSTAAGTPDDEFLSHQNTSLKQVTSHQIGNISMIAINEISRRLQKYPQAAFEVEGNRATVLPSDGNGFKVTLIDNTPSYTVFFDSWHEEYEKIEDALDCFAFGLSEDCRLKVSYRGNFAYLWSVEERNEDGQWFGCQWIGCNEMGLLAPPLFWLRKKHTYLRNYLLSGLEGQIGR